VSGLSREEKEMQKTLILLAMFALAAPAWATNYTGDMERAAAVASAQTDMAVDWSPVVREYKRAIRAGEIHGVDAPALKRKVREMGGDDG
jgi:hypothetical protein